LNQFLTGKDRGKFIFWTPEDLDISQEEYLSLIDGTNSEVLRLLRYRKRFLHFIDMLNTYEVSRARVRMSRAKKIEGKMQNEGMLYE
jgi:hypothetical protein